LRLKFSGSLTLDVTSKESIANAVKTIETTDGKLDALINKYVDMPRVLICINLPFPHSAAIMGAFRSSWADPNSPERKEPFTVGSALFESDSFEEWDEVLRANTVSLYFVTLAFLELLQKGSKDRAEYSASVINITSYFGSTKPSYGHVSFNSLTSLL
jgi:NAD(P)-dependent dehydrogenase (short-subunit alcohol dehydrogenase family)